MTTIDLIIKHIAQGLGFITIPAEFPQEGSVQISAHRSGGVNLIIWENRNVDNEIICWYQDENGDEMDDENGRHSLSLKIADYDDLDGMVFDFKRHIQKTDCA